MKIFFGIRFNQMGWFTYVGSIFLSLIWVNTIGDSSKIMYSNRAGDLEFSVWTGFANKTAKSFTNYNLPMCECPKDWFTSIVLLMQGLLLYFVFWWIESVRDKEIQEHSGGLCIFLFVSSGVYALVFGLSAGVYNSCMNVFAVAKTSNYNTFFIVNPTLLLCAATIALIHCIHVYYKHIWQSRQQRLRMLNENIAL